MGSVSEYNVYCQILWTSAKEYAQKNDRGEEKEMKTLACMWEKRIFPETFSLPGGSGKTLPVTHDTFFPFLDWLAMYMTMWKKHVEKGKPSRVCFKKLMRSFDFFEKILTPSFPPPQPTGIY